ncbi:1,4-alpha-glucan branching protein domain-containing protein [Treponema pedis]|uniref:1,4-alpha-glucan branching protein domain-containing protein n=1 Tax=Treponema pedis TaxID=409322 RepID=UPI003133DF8C
MKNNKFVFILDAHLPYIPSEADGGIEQDRLFDSLSYTYLPVIKMCENLKKDTPFKMGIVFEPALCEMLADVFFQERYKKHIERKIEFAKKELERCAGCEKTKKLIQYNLKVFSDDKRTFEDCGGNILKKFDMLSKEGYIEILATTATSCFLPFFESMPEAVSAQIEMGQINYRKHFSSIPSGFWLPALAYCEGLEEIIRSYGYSYTLVETRAFLLADKAPPAGIFAPAAAENGLIFLASDAPACRSIYDKTDSFSSNPVYMDVENDVGFKLPEKYLASVFDTSRGRRPIGFRYWAKDEDESIYDIEKAREQIEIDAKTFVEARISTLNSVRDTTVVRSPVSVFICSSDFLGKRWCEGIAWIERVFKLISESESIEAVLPEQAAHISKQVYTVKPFFSSLFDSGYAAELLTGKTDWMYRYMLKMTERMIKLTEMFPEEGGLKERVLNAAAREVFLMQAFYWPFYGATTELQEFAENRFLEHIKAFTVAYESLGADAPDAKWLSEREHKYPIFKEINYRSFCKKR